MPCPVDKYNSKVVPKIPAVQAKNIPKELKARSTWVMWKWAWNGKKWSKPPCNIEGETMNHLESSLSFKEAIAASSSSLGIGLSLREEDPFCGIDLDGVLTKKGKLKKKFSKIKPLIKGFYTEISPSGTGLRIFGRGNPPTLGSKKGSPLEIYTQGRYLTVTGNLFPTGWKGKKLQDLEEVCEKLRELFSSRQERGEKEREEGFERPEREDRNFTLLCQKIWQFPADGYDEWLKMGMIIHDATNASERGFGLWLMWSKTSDNFTSEKECWGKWKGFGIGDREKLSIGTFKRWIREREDSLHGKTHFEDAEEATDFFNRDHAIVLVKGKALVANFTKEEIIFSKREDFHAYHEPKIITTEDNKILRASRVWQASAGANRCKNVIFDPSLPIGFNPGEDAFLNTWLGFDVEPDPSGCCDRYLDHLGAVICGGDEYQYNYLLNILANIVQNPGGRRPGVAVVLQGKEGTGKGAFVNAFGGLFNKFHYTHLISPEDLIGRFGGFALSQSVVVFADEAFFCGNKAAEGKLKGLISEKRIMAEEKFMPKMQFDSHINIFIATNELSAVRASKEARRYFCPDIDQSFFQDKEHFDDVFEEMEKEKARGALLHFLLEYPIDKEILFGGVPDTKSLRIQKALTEEHHIDGFFEWFIEYLKEGRFPSKNGYYNPGTRSRAYVFQEAYPLYCNEKKKQHYEIIDSPKTFWRIAKERFPGIERCFGTGGSKNLRANKLISLIEKNGID